MERLGICISGRFRLQRKIGKGGSAEVFQAIDKDTGDSVAVKMAHRRDGFYVDEAPLYESLAGGCGIPKVFWKGQHEGFDVLVLELLGHSLDKLFRGCGYKFSLKTVLMIADQLICRLRYLHSKNYIHRDVKPSNFVLGIGRQDKCIYVIDLEMASEKQESEHTDQSLAVPNLFGTSPFASINGHFSSPQSPRDDMESLGYTLIYFIQGNLPWYHRSAHRESEETHRLILDMKKSIGVEELCGDLPQEFALYIQHVRSLDFSDKPDYSYLRRIFRDLFVRSGFKFDLEFDWIIK